MADGDPFAPYENPQITERVVEGLAVVEAEVRGIREGRSPRTHLRIIGGLETSVAGRALVYADTYTRDPEDQTYSYARHSVDQTGLLEGLEGFLATALLVEFGELRNRPAAGVMQTESGIREFEAPTYLDAVAAMKREPLIFARLNFPFGGISVEFQEQANIAEDEFRFIEEGMLQRDLERPLFGFDATKSHIWTTFLASIHWARDRVEPEVLRQVLRMAARVTA